MNSPNSSIVSLTKDVLITIAEVPEGAPAGPMYLAFQTIGVTLDTFNLYMMSLERLGLITKRHDCYFVTTKGNEYLARTTDSTELAPVTAV